MRYDEALRFMYALEPRGVRLELDRVRQALAMRGDPHRGLAYVHVAGTNGKGSVSAMIERGLRAAGRRTGLYTSPHLHRFVERVRVNGRTVSEAAIAKHVTSVRETLEAAGAPELTFFEVATIVAFECFREARCEVVVLEVGLGGRLDATNVVDPKLTVITRIARDHESRLGGTIAEIAGEKAGILKRGVPAVAGVRDPEALRVVLARAGELDAPVRVIDRDFAVEGAEASGAVTVRAGDARIGPLRPALAGVHQRDNVATAVASLVALRELGIEVPDAAIRDAIARVKWPGRLERIARRPDVIVDAAHNPDGCAALAAHLATLPRRGPRVLVFGAMADKDHEAMLGAFDPVVDERIYAAPRMARAAPAETFAAIRPGTVSGSVEDAVARARERAGEAGLVVVAGSIFTMAEARASILGLRSEPAIGM